MNSKYRVALAASLALCVPSIVAAQDGPKKEYTAPREPATPNVVRASEAAATAFTGSQFGWVSPRGTWDGKGRFDENLGSVFYVANAHQYSEDANFCYYQETTATTWLWALAKNPTQGTTNYAIWVSTASATTPSWSIWSADGHKLTRAGNP